MNPEPNGGLGFRVWGFKGFRDLPGSQEYVGIYQEDVAMLDPRRLRQLPVIQAPFWPPVGYWSWSPLPLLPSGHDFEGLRCLGVHGLGVSECRAVRPSMDVPEVREASDEEMRNLACRREPEHPKNQMKKN